MRRILIAFLITIPLVVSGCAMSNNRNNIEDSSLIRIFGIDYKDGNYTVTILYENSINSQDDQKFKSIYGEGATVYEAYEEIKHKSELYPSPSQIKFFILGEEAAKNGIKATIDFPIRNEAIKTDVQVMLVSGKTASEVIENNDADSFLGDTLQTIEHKEMKTTKHIDSTLEGIGKYYTSGLQDYLIINLDASETIYINGYGVIHNDKLVDVLDYETSLGVNFVLGNIQSVPVYAKDFSAIITDISSKRVVDIINNKFYYTIKTDFSTIVREVNFEIISYDFNILRQEQNEYINTLIQKAVSYIQTTGYDIINAKQLFMAYHPYKWDRIKNDYDAKNIKFNIETKSNINKTLTIS